MYSLSGQQVFGGSIIGPGALQLNSGALTLTSTGNTFSGGTTISGGTLQIGVNTGPTTDGSLLGQITNNSLLVFDNYAAGTYGGVINGSGAVTKSGLGLLTFTNSSTYGGGTVISGGTLQIGNGGSNGSLGLSSTVTDYGALVFDLSSPSTYSGLITGAGNVAQIGSGLMTLTGSNTSSGQTLVSAGSLQLGVGGATGTITGSIYVGNGTFLLDRSGTMSNGLAAPAPW